MKRFIYILCFYLLIITIQSIAKPELEQFTVMNTDSISIKNNYLLLFCDNAYISIEAYSPTIVRVALYTDFNNVYDNSPALIASPHACKVDIIQYQDSINYRTDSLLLVVHKNPFAIDYYNSKGEILSKNQDFFKVYEYRGFHSDIDSSENFYAIGSQNMQLNRHGKTFFIFNQNQYAYKPGSTSLNFNVPLIISSKLYAYYIDNYSVAYLSIGDNDKNKMQYNAEYGQFSFFFMYRTSYTGILSDYSKLTGLQPLPPKWAFGYHQSKFGYYNRNEVMTKIPEIRRQGFPIDIVIFDYTWFGFPERMGTFNWYTPNWGNAKTMIDSLKDIGIQSILITEPFISIKTDNYNEAKNLNLFLNEQSGIPVIFNLLYTDLALIDIFKPEAQTWFWNKYKAATDIGIAGWWCDLGEPEYSPYYVDFSTGHMLRLHNIYNMIWNKMLYEGSLKEYPNKRPYIMSRSGWSGSQRYGVIPQCGDNYRSFGMLKNQIPQMLSMGLSGIPYFSSDIGGFAADENAIPIPQLYTRWMQFGAFSPIMRTHMSGIGAIPEPIYWDDSTKQACKKIIKLRYRMFPYNYTTAYNTTQTGIPIARTMNFYDNSEQFRDTSFQYYWGDNFIVAPVYDSARFNQNIALPVGNWINYWNNQKYKGNQTIFVDAPFDEIPLMVKSSSIIPMTNDIVCLNDYKYDSLEVNYYPDIQYPDSHYSMYEDDGNTPDADKKGLYRFTDFDASVSDKKIEFSINVRGDSYLGAPQNQYYTLNIIKPSFIPDSITIDGKNLIIEKDINLFEHSDSSVYINYQDSIIRIKFIRKNNQVKIEGFELTKSDVNNSDELQDIVLSPNPFRDFIEVKIPNRNQSSFQLEIYDIKGNLLNKIYPVSSDKEYLIFKWSADDFDGKQVNSGSYLFGFDNGKIKLSQKAVFIR